MSAWLSGDEEAGVQVAGKVVAVTGGGNGIGQEAVLELLRRGARGCR